MSKQRLARIGDEYKREISSLIAALKDPRVQGMISVTNVEVTPDFGFAKVYVSVLNKSDERDVLKGLSSASGYLRHEMASRVQLRVSPQIVFYPDDSIDRGSRVISILEGLEHGSD